MKRVPYFDNAKAILICLVVFGHMISKYIETESFLAKIYLFIYTFHMPAFVLISGYFAKKINQSGYFQKLIKKLLIPYAVFQIFYTFYYVVFFQDEIEFSLLVPRWGLWFLISMLFWNLLLYFFIKIKFGIPLAVLISLFVGYDSNVDELLSLSRTFFFFPFFIVGYYLKEEHFILLKSRINVVIGILIAIIGFVLIYLYVPIDFSSWLLGKRPFDEISDMPFYYDWFMRFCTYVMTAVATYMFLTLVPTRETFFTSIGKSTMTIYLLHMALVRIFYDSSLFQYIAKTNQYWIAIVLSIFIVYILSRKPFNTLVSKLSFSKSNKVA